MTPRPSPAPVDAPPAARTRALARALAQPVVAAVAVALGATLMAPAAHAEPDEATARRAEDLFREGEQLFDKRKFAEACAKFAESHDLDPKLGSLLNLAFCHESEGKTARARSEFIEAMTWAVQKAQKDRERFAREHLAALEKRLSYLVLDPPVIDPDNLDVRVDGLAVPRSRWGAPLVVDPGLHMLTSSAPLKEPQPLLFYVEPGPSTRTLRIPSLLDDPVAAAMAARNGARDEGPAPSAARAAKALRTRRTVGLVALGAGAVSAGLGVYFAARTVGAAADLRNACDPGPCTADAASLRTQGQSLAVGTAVATGLGVAALGVGTYLVLTGGLTGGARPNGAASTPSALARAPTPFVSPTAAGLAWAGSF